MAVKLCTSVAISTPCYMLLQNLFFISYVISLSAESHPRQVFEDMLDTPQTKTILVHVWVVEVY